MVSGYGQWIYFGSQQAGIWQVWKVPVQGGRPVQATRQGGEWGVESVDGKFFYYRLNGAIWRMRAEGGEEKLVIPSVDPQDFEVVEQGIYFVSASQRPAIQFFDFGTGGTKTIAEYGEPAGNPASHVAGWGLSASPDRRSLLFTKREDRSVDLMLVENFR